MGDMKFGEFYDRVMAIEKESPGQKAFLNKSWFQSNTDAFDEKYVVPAASKFKSKILSAFMEAVNNAQKGTPQIGPGGTIKKEGNFLTDEVLKVFVEAFNEQFPSCTMSVDRIKSKLMDHDRKPEIESMTPNEFLFHIFADGMGEQLG